MKNIAKNFTWDEVTNWSKHQSKMSVSDKLKAKTLAEKALTSTTKKNAQLIATSLQLIRDLVNTVFPEYKGSIGVRPLSWLRALAWEKYRKRSGTSQHVEGHGVDFVLTGIPAEDAQKIMKWLFKLLENWEGGLAVKYDEKGNIVFIHIDLGKKRRWVY